MLSKRQLSVCIASAAAWGVPAHALAPPLYDIATEDIRRALEAGATLVGYMDQRLFVERYDQGGRLRGVYGGRAYEGRWRIESDRLCTDVAPGPPVCVVVKGASGVQMVDGLNLWVLPVSGAPAMGATFLTQAPWVMRSPYMTVPVRVLSPGADSFAAAGTVEGLPQTFVVWTGRPIGGNGERDLLIHGTNDRVTFTAERVTQLDGSPIP